MRLGSHYLVVSMDDVLFVGIDVIDVLRAVIFSQTFLLPVDDLAAIQETKCDLRLDECNDYRDERRQCCAIVTCVRVCEK